jgi:uncharacterized membrane protein
MLSDSFMLAMVTAVAQGFELAGIAVIVLGALVAAWRFAVDLTRSRADRTRDQEGPLPAFRRTLGRSVLIGLELLVAADIIQTVAVEPTLSSVLVLGLIVVIRTFLSFSLEVEIDGRWPWQQAVRERGDRPDHD